MCACVGSGLSLSRKRPLPIDVPHKRRQSGAAENPVTPPTARAGDPEVLQKWVEFYQRSRMRHVDDEGDPAIGTSPFDQDGDYGFDNSDVFDQKVSLPISTDRYGAPTLDTEDVLDDAQPSSTFIPTAPLAFYADDESDGEDSDEGAGSHAARALRKAEYSDDDSGDEEAVDAEPPRAARPTDSGDEHDFSEVESDQNSSHEDLDSQGSSDDDDDDDEVGRWQVVKDNEVFPTAWSAGDEE